MAMSGPVEAHPITVELFKKPTAETWTRAFGLLADAMFENSPWAPPPLVPSP